MADGNSLKSIGIALLVLGALSVIFEIASIVLWVNGGLLITNAPGIYTGIWAIVTGSVNLASARAATTCNVVSGLIFAILLCFASVYMSYWEITAILAAQAVEVTAVMATHSLTFICGVGIAISACFSWYFNQKARAAGLES